MTPADIVLLTLTEEPAKAEAIAAKANLGICQTYQALVQLYDRGVAFLVSGDDAHRIAGWVR